MAAIATVPVLDHEKKAPSEDSVIDEKLSVDDNIELAPGHAPLVDLRTAALSDKIGDVYDDVRAIDLGADGKERPIGEDFAKSP